MNHFEGLCYSIVDAILGKIDGWEGGCYCSQDQISGVVDVPSLGDDDVLQAGRNIQ